jgi:hypothetical protein
MFFKFNNPFWNSSNVLFNSRIHVRRTDKNSEADFLPLSAYLDKANEYFQLHEEIKQQTIANKTIYLLTDEPDVIEEAVQK